MLDKTTTAPVGIVHAIVLGEVDLRHDFYLVHNMRRTRKQFIDLMPSTPLTTVMRRHAFHGPCLGVTAAVELALSCLAMTRAGFPPRRGSHRAIRAW